jgi:predicted esterase
MQDARILVGLLMMPLACGGSPTGAESGTDVPFDATDVEDVEDAADAPDAPDAEPDVGEGEDAGEDVEEDVPGDTPDGGEDGTDAGPRVVTCADEPPPGSPEPDPLPVYAGSCPDLTPGRITISSSGVARQFLLVVPSEPGADESFPVLFLWHWLGGDADDFLDKGEVQAAADRLRFIAAIPEAKGDLPFKWPYSLLDGDARLAEELRFFDDMLACIGARFRVNRHCVSSAGVSAGALWTAQLAPRRSRLLSSFLSLSGGVGREGDWLNPVRTWVEPEHRPPAIVLWGGPTDFCGITFQTTSRYLEDELTAGGHFFLECVHNCAHSEPPLEPPPGESKYEAIWAFPLHHPYWLDPGESPYLVTGLPANLPAWCGIGPGSATIRSGECEGGILGSCM